MVRIVTWYVVHPHPFIRGNGLKMNKSSLSLCPCFFTSGMGAGGIHAYFFFLHLLTNTLHCSFFFYCLTTPHDFTYQLLLPSPHSPFNPPIRLLLLLLFVFWRLYPESRVWREDTIPDSDRRLASSGYTGRTRRHDQCSALRHRSEVGILHGNGPT